METMRTTLRRGRNVWDKINMPESVFQERVEKIRSEMKKEDIDVLLVYGDAWREYGNPSYISNYYPSMGGAIALIPRQGEVALLFWGSARGIEYTQNITWIKELRPGADIISSCVKYLEELGLFPSTIGLAGLKQLMPYLQLQSFYKSLSGCKIVDADHIVSDMRMVKSPRERDQIQRASRILTRAFDIIANAPLESLNEIILEATLDRYARLEGAEDVRILIAKPQEQKWAFRPVEDSQMLPGETVIIYLAVEFERYWSEIIRTFVVEPSCLAPAKGENYSELYEKIMRMLKPGKPVSRFYMEALSELEKSGTGYIQDYGLGQGIGQSTNELPVITEEDASELKEGMCLTLRLAMRDKEMGAFMMGNTIHLSKDSPELLTG